jgi:hypothetical protein
MLKTVAASSGGTTGALVYQGTWNALSNAPTLASSVGTKGYYYVVSTAGSTNLNGITDWQINDWAIFNGTIWEKIDNTDSVISVNGQTGIVVLGAANVGATPNTTYVIAGTGIAGGGQLTGNVTINLGNTAVSSGTYGSVTNSVTITVDAQGRITSLSNTGIAIASANVSGLGTMSVQNSNAVTITGGSVNVQTTNLTANSSVSATFVTSSLPLIPEGYITVSINNVEKKIPYYGV